jgi:hypothetical protein
MELNKENKMKSGQAVLPNPCLEEEEGYSFSFVVRPLYNR